MNRTNIMGGALLCALSLFVIFNYMPSLMELSALENERQILLQMGNKVRELETVLTRDDLIYRAKLVSTRRQLSRQALAPQEEAKSPSGNRGYVIRDGKVQNPFSPVR